MNGLVSYLLRFMNVYAGELLCIMGGGRRSAYHLLRLRNSRIEMHRVVVRRPSLLLFLFGLLHRLKCGVV